jgi:hypothetical protein
LLSPAQDFVKQFGIEAGAMVLKIVLSRSAALDARAGYGGFCRYINGLALGWQAD